MKVVWTERALTDLREIRNWISTDSPCYAFRMVERVVECAESLETMPRRGHAVPEAQADDILEIHSEPYRIIYKVFPDSVGILSIVHMARNLGLEEPGSEWDGVIRERMARYDCGKAKTRLASDVLSKLESI